MNKFEQRMKVFRTKTEWAKNKPTLKERRNEKKMSQILEYVASRLYSVEFIDFNELISKYKGLSNIYKYFFPEAVDIIEVPQEHHVIKVHNVAYVTFNKNK